MMGIMRRALRKHLVCPDSGAPLELEETTVEGDDVIEGALVAGDARYVVREGIPSFVSDDVAEDQTVRSFAQKWAKHRYYRAHTAKFYTEWYISRYDFGDTDGLAAFLKDKAMILDAGTGAGRDATNFANHSEGTVFAADTAWEALSVARADEAVPANIVHLHADVNRLPVPDGFFDFINCDQVIHHTPDPPRTFQNLRRKLKVGGEVCCYVYKKKAVVREFTDDYVRERIRDLPIEEALRSMEAITKLGQALADLKTTIDVPEDIPLLGIEKGQVDIQRFFHWNVMKCFWNDDFDFFTNNIINFDWYHPIYCFRYTPEEFRSWFDEGWEIQAWDVQDAGISCRATKI